MSETLVSSLSVDVNALQRQASDPTRSVWVGASAGSGKTKVLADRVTRLLLADVAPQRLLCLTFTKAAAAEMSIRLMQRLSRWAISDEEALDADLIGLEGEVFDPALRERARRLFARVLACPGGMRIQTIHGFAQEILRRFPIEAGVSPHFAVLEEVEAAALRQEAMDEVLEEAAEGRDQASAAALTQVVRFMAEQSLRELLAELMNQAPKLRAALQANAGPQGLGVALRVALGLAPDASVETLQRGAACEGFDNAGLREAARLLLDKGTPSFQKRGQLMLAWFASDEAARMVGLGLYTSAFLTQDGKPFAKSANKDLLGSHPECEAVLREEAERLMRFESQRQALEATLRTESVLTLALRVAQAYERRKDERAVMDYDDLIRKTNEVLARPAIAPWVLYKLDGGIDHMLVDESQDTNPGQWQIIQTLADEYCQGESARSDRVRTLFVVGDEKQSIFSFQGADPDVFFQMHALFRTKFRAARMPFDDVPLTISFRSAPAVLRAVDAVFEPEAARQGVSREPVHHQAFRGQGAGRVEVWPLLTQETGAAPEAKPKGPSDWVIPEAYETVRDPASELAQKIAQQIQNWVSSGVMIYDRELRAERAMNPGDVMILVRTRGTFVDVLVRELKARDVPVSGVDRMVLTEQLAVMDVMALLQCALLPEDDLTLATVLRGPLIGASEDELMALALGREGTLWDALRTAAGPWTAYLQKIAALADVTPPLPLLIKILSEPCPADAQSARRALATRLGPDAEDPLDELLNAASDFGQRHTPSLQSFLHWLSVSEAQIKRELEQAMGRVRITTVHASKGLEAPIVILPDTASVPDKKRMPKLVWTKEGLPFYLPREQTNETLRALREAVYARQMEEYRRLLYVALTRAADRLIVCGFKAGERQIPEACWYNVVSAGLAAHHQAEVLPEAQDALSPQIILADYALVAKGPRAAPQSEASLALPSWLFAQPGPEPEPPRPLVPSQPSAPEPSSISPQDARFARGRVMHRLLQNLPEVEGARRAFVAARFLANPQHGLAEAAQAEMAGEVLRLLGDPACAPFFGPTSRAEVPIVGLSGNRLISGQVDRLALVGDEVWVVDYKTNRPPPRETAAVPALYRQQMAAYRTVLQEIYPAKTIRTFLLWTFTLQLMEILPET